MKQPETERNLPALAPPGAPSGDRLPMALKVGRGACAPPFIVMDVIAAANARAAALPPDAPGVIRMEVGQPGTGAPPARPRRRCARCRPACRSATRRPSACRASARASPGTTPNTTALDVPPARVAVTVGASGAFPLAFLAAFDPGDAVAMAAPFYPPYANILTALGMKPLLLACDASTRFQPTVAMLEQLDPRPAGLILASPCNPAGTMLPPEEFIAIARWCEAEGVRLISDEIYHGLTYGELQEETAAAHSAERRGGEQLLQVLEHDRLAHRLALAAGRPAAPGGMPRAEPLHLRAPRRAGRGRGGHRLRARARSEPRALPPQPRPLAARAAARRPRPPLPGGRRLLSLGRCRRT